MLDAGVEFFGFGCIAWLSRRGDGFTRRRRGCFDRAARGQQKNQAKKNPAQGKIRVGPDHLLKPIKAVPGADAETSPVRACLLRHESG